MKISINGRERCRASCVLDDPRLGVFLLDLTGEFDAGHGLSHSLPLIALERFLFHHRERPNLAEVKVRIDVGFGHQIAAGVDLVRCLDVDSRSHRGDVAVSNPDFDEPVAATPQPSPAYCDIKLPRHDGTTGCRKIIKGCGQATGDLPPFAWRRKLMPLLCPSRRSDKG